MYIRKSSRTYNGKTYFNYVLVESVLTAKGPRQKIICSLGDLRPLPRAEWLELAHKLASALSGQHELLAGQASDPELEQLYDVTATFLEGRAMANPKAKRGYSRDHRPDCKQVLIGLAVNRDGFPLAHEVFAGNCHDST